MTFQGDYSRDMTTLTAFAKTFVGGSVSYFELIITKKCKVLPFWYG